MIYLSYFLLLKVPLQVGKGGSQRIMFLPIYDEPKYVVVKLSIPSPLDIGQLVEKVTMA